MLGKPGAIGAVYAVYDDGDYLYLGGDFTDAGGNPDADYVVRFDGANFEPLAAGLNGSVEAIIRYGADIYIGGFFTDVGGESQC